MDGTSCVTFATFILGVGVTLVSSLIQPIPLPKDLEACIDYRTSHYNESRSTLHMIQEFCLTKFLSLNPELKHKVNFTTEEDHYINSLFRQIIGNIDHSNEHGRFRRQTRVRRRLRREIRSAPYRHWQQYTNAVRRLKRDWSGANGRSRYDTIAAIHTAAVQSVHFGPAFLPWHRMYLVLFETALRVPIPYWDTTIDSELNDPSESIVWTSKYFGNGRGRVVNGPFQNFYTPTGPLRRDIGDDGMLMSKQGVQRILRRRWNSEIFEPSYDQMSSLEGIHNQAHFWVGGHTNDFEHAAYDPLFWNFHAFVDFVWEVFRGLQRRRGINPERDIVDSNDWQQSPNRRAFGFRSLTIRDGYTSRFSRIVRYDPMPKCPECGGSSDMYCNRGRQVCFPAIQQNGRSQRSRPWSFGRRRWRGKRSTLNLSQNIQIMNDDNNTEINNFVFFPVKIVRVDRGETEIMNLLNTTRRVSQVINPICLHHPRGFLADNIDVQSSGLNYRGTYKNYIKLHDKSVLNVAIKRPGKHATEAYISAFDKCGRICVPNCLVKNTLPPVYKTCSGAIRATMKEPFMFLTFESAFSSHLLQTNVQDQIIPIVFHCSL